MSHTRFALRFAIAPAVLAAVALAMPPATTAARASLNTTTTTDSPPPNLLDANKSSFTSTTGGWYATGASLSRVVSPSQSSNGALRVTATAAGTVGLYSGSGTTTYTAVVPGAGYQAGLWVRAATTGRAVQPFLVFYDASGAAIAWNFGSGVVDSRSTYVPVAAVNGAAPAGARYAAVGAVVYGVVKDEIHYIDTARLQQTGAPTTKASSPLLGLFDEDFGGRGDPARYDALESWQGRGNAITMTYTNFDARNIDVVFPRIRQMWDRGIVPMVNWMPWIGNSTGTDYDLQIANGAYDDYIRSWAAAMKTFLAGPDGNYGNADDRRAYLRFAHEMNGDWYPYSPAYGIAPATSFVAMWRHVHDLFVASGIDDPTRLSWVFSANNVEGRVRTEDLFPGDDYVDWVGVDGYNWGTLGGHQFQTPSEVFDPMVKRLRAISSKPIGINEVAADQAGMTLAAKLQWITDYFTWAKRAGIGMTIWFNSYPEEHQIFGSTLGDETSGGYNGYSTYRTAVQDPAFLSSDRTSSRLVTDAQFTGVAA